MQFRGILSHTPPSAHSASPMPTDDSATVAGSSCSAPSPPATLVDSKPKGKAAKGAKKQAAPTAFDAVQSSIQKLYKVLSVDEYERTGCKYACLYEGCGRKYPRRNAIVEHLCKHLDYKPHKCSYDDW